ncbi:MAG: hypothetical protein JKY94_17790 [Rhodobacteraceae bacterium]|nr:hypothetical protein [Paracoccaceae bacterium]
MDLKGGTDAQFLKTTIERQIARARTAIPATVEAFDVETQLVTVRPAIRQVITLDDERSFRDLPVIVRAPVAIPRTRNGGYALTFPILPGDEVLLVFADRSIDNWVASGGDQNPVEPNVSRTHDLADAMVIPGLGSEPGAVTDYNNDGIEIRNGDRSSRVTVTDGQVTAVQGASSITVTSSAVAVISPSFTHNGKEIGETHTHSDTQPGSGNTGEPN